MIKYTSSEINYFLLFQKKAAFPPDPLIADTFAGPSEMYVESVSDSSPSSRKHCEWCTCSCNEQRKEHTPKDVTLSTLPVPSAGSVSSCGTMCLKHATLQLKRPQCLVVQNLTFVISRPQSISTIINPYYPPNILVNCIPGRESGLVWFSGSSAAATAEISFYSP